MNFRDIHHYIKNRWFQKTHQLTSKLKKGEWHDLDERILHCLYDSLVEFVEQEVGMESLERQSKFTGKDWGFEETNPEYNEPVPQALYAQETINLYKWWIEDRPQRPDPYEVSGWNNYCDTNSIEQLLSTTTEEGFKLIEKSRYIEQLYDNEDTEMLIRLIKIRHYLWT